MRLSEISGGLTPPPVASGDLIVDCSVRVLSQWELRVERCERDGVRVAVRVRESSGVGGRGERRH